MSDANQLLSEIDEFLAATGMSNNAFGKAVLNDAGFMPRFRRSGSATLRTAEKIRKYIAANSHKRLGVRVREIATKGDEVTVTFAGSIDPSAPFTRHIVMAREDFAAFVGDARRRNRGVKP